MFFYARGVYATPTTMEIGGIILYIDPRCISFIYKR